MSPAVLRKGPYRFYFVSHDLQEPPHVHSDRDAFSAAHNLGFSALELRKLEEITPQGELKLGQRHSAAG